LEIIALDLLVISRLLGYGGFVTNDTPNFNLINITYNNVTGGGNLQPTKYYEIMKNAYEQFYVQSSERVFPTASP
jgi:hypothetical protein